MAYLVDIVTSCSKPYCTTRASVELRGWINERRGQFCKKHGKEALRAREKFEKENPQCR